MRFAMPKPVTISGRSSSITNSFVNAIIPVIHPTEAQIDEALAMLEMGDRVECVYCGDPHTEWDHLRPLIVNKAPTGYISEIHNLVPACGKCNQSKGNKQWRLWMYSAARLSPATRGVADLDDRAATLDTYEAWKPPTRLDFAEIVGHAAWERHEQNRVEILRLMREADLQAAAFRTQIRAAYESETRA